MIWIESVSIQKCLLCTQKLRFATAAWVEVGWGGCSGVPPSPRSLTSCGEIKHRGPVSMGWGTIEHYPGSIKEQGADSAEQTRNQGQS